MPSAWVAMPMRPASSTAMAILKPSPSSPRRFSDRAAVILEEDLAGGRGADAQLGLFLAAHIAWLVGVDQEGGDAAVLLLRVGHGEQHQVIRHRSAGDPGFAPIDHVVIAVAHRPAAHRARIRAGHGLGQRVGADGLAAGYRGQVLLLLRLGAVLEDAVAEQRVVHRHDRAVGGVHLADLFQRQHVCQRVHACPAVFFGHFDAHEAHLAHLFDRLDGKFARFVELCGDRGDLFLGKVLCSLADHFVFLREGEKTTASH